MILARYGPEPYHIEFELEFPQSMVDPQSRGIVKKIVIELGPLAYVPYSVYIFTEVVRNFQHGAFHRMAGHVTQALVRLNSNVNGMAFQEYHPSYPHIKGSLGYAGRPGGPEFYISLVDNSNNHGPGSQGSKTEADGCFGRVIEGWDEVVEKMMKKQQGGSPKSGGFIGKKEDFIVIKSLRFKK